MFHNKLKHRKIIMPFIILCGILFFYLQFKVISTPFGLEIDNADAIIILGHSLEDGENPGQWLIGRLEEGLSLYNSGYADTIIVTGGEGPSDNIAVALSMKKWLVEKGIDESRIIAETDAKNTYENFKYIYDLIISEKLDIESVIVVSSDFHMYRSLKIGNYFFHQIYGSASHVPMSFMKIPAYIKEPFSVIKYTVINFFNSPQPRPVTP